MKTLPTKWAPLWAAIAVIAGFAVLVIAEVIDDPSKTFTDILLEMLQPAVIVIISVTVVRLFGRMERQHEEQLSLLKDLEVARSEGAQWRTDMREVLKGLGLAIDGQFERWQLTVAERDVALLMLKGLSHREIAIARDTSERTIRQQAQAIYAKANLSGRAALSAFFLEDLLLPREQN